MLQPLQVEAETADAATVYVREWQQLQLLLVLVAAAPQLTVQQEAEVTKAKAPTIKMIFE